MADGEQSREPEASSCNLTITEDGNSSLNNSVSALENELNSQPYKYGFGLCEYYKLCLHYYHKEKKIIKISYDDKLQLTAFWKQLSSGKFDTAKFPEVGYFDVIGSDRKRAWETLGDMSRTEAMENFCILLEECSPELKPWMEAQKGEAEERERLRREEVEEKQKKEADEAAEKERLRLQAEEEARRKVEEEEEERRRLEEIIKRQKIKRQEQILPSQQVDGLQQSPPPQEPQQVKAPSPLVNGVPRIAPASLWTRPKVTEFIQHVKSDPSSVLVVGRGETMTVRVPTHDSGTCLFWEFATEHYDLGFGVSFEWSQPNSKSITVAVNESDDDEFGDDEDKPREVEASPSSPPRPRVDEILPVVRRPCHEEVIVGSHMYPGRGVYLLKFDNSYSLFRAKTLYYRVYYTR